MRWSAVHGVLVYAAFLKNNESVLKMQRTLRIHFPIGKQQLRWLHERPLRSPKIWLCTYFQRNSSSAPIPLWRITRGKHAATVKRIVPVYIDLLTDCSRLEKEANPVEWLVSTCARCHDHGGRSEIASPHILEMCIKRHVTKIRTEIVNLYVDSDSKICVELFLKIKTLNQTSNIVVEFSRFFVPTKIL